MDILLNRNETRALLFKALGLPVDDTTRFIFTTGFQKTKDIVLEKHKSGFEGTVIKTYPRTIKL